MDEFRSNVRDWVAFDDKISKVNKSIGKVRERKNELANNISIFLEVKNWHDKEIKVNNNRLKCNVKEKLTPITKKFIQETITEYTGDSKRAKDIAKFIYDPNQKLLACLTYKLGDEEEARKMLEHILSRREKTVVRTIRRKKKRVPVSIPVDNGPISNEATRTLETPSSSSVEEEHDSDYE